MPLTIAWQLCTARARLVSTCKLFVQQFETSKQPGLTKQFKKQTVYYKYYDYSIVVGGHGKSMRASKAPAHPQQHAGAMHAASRLV